MRGFRALATADGFDGIPVANAPAAESQCRVVIALATRAAVFDGEAVITPGPGKVNVRFVRLDQRGKALLAHMIEQRTAEVPAPVPRHLIPLGAVAGTQAAVRPDVSAACTLEALPAAAAGLGARREPAPPTLRDVRPLAPHPAPAPGAGAGAGAGAGVGAAAASDAVPQRPKREAQRTLMGMPTQARPKTPSAPPPATTPSSSSPGLVVAAGTPPGVPTDSVPVPKPRPDGMAETGPTRPTRAQSEPSPAIKKAAQALRGTGPAAAVPSSFDAVPTVPTAVPNIRAMVPSRIDSAPSGPVDDQPTIPNDDIQTDVAVALPDLPGGGEEMDPLVEPPPPMEAPMVAAAYAPPVPFYPAMPPQRPMPPQQVMPPQQAMPPQPAPYYQPQQMHMYPPTAQLPALQVGPIPGAGQPWLHEPMDRDGDMTELVQLVRPPRRRWPVIAVTSGVIVIGVAVMVYVAASSQGKDDEPAARKPSASASPLVTSGKPPPAPPAPASVEATAPAAKTDVAPAPAAAGTCKVQFTSSPDAAEVVIAGKVAGLTPFTYEGSCGGFDATFRRERYQPQTHAVAPGAAAAEVRLERPSFKIRVTSRPAGATVSIAGVAAGKTPVTVALPGYETTSIELSRSGYAPITQRVYAGKSGQKVDVKLKPRRR